MFCWAHQPWIRESLKLRFQPNQKSSKFSNARQSRLANCFWAKMSKSLCEVWPQKRKILNENFETQTRKISWEKMMISGLEQKVEKSGTIKKLSVSSGTSCSSDGTEAADESPRERPKGPRLANWPIKIPYILQGLHLLLHRSFEFWMQLWYATKLILQKWDYLYKQVVFVLYVLWLVFSRLRTSICCLDERLC